MGNHITHMLRQLHWLRMLTSDFHVRQRAEYEVACNSASVVVLLSWGRQLCRWRRPASSLISSRLQPIGHASSHVHITHPVTKASPSPLPVRRCGISLL